MAKELQIPNHISALAASEQAILDLNAEIEKIDKAITARAADLLSRRVKLLERRATYQARRQRYEQAIISLMEANKRAKVKTEQVELSVRRGQQSVKIDDESAVPDEFKERTWVETVDKKRLKAHLVAHPDDAEVFGARLERGPSKLKVEWLEQSQGIDTSEAPYMSDARTAEVEDFNDEF